MNDPQNLGLGELGQRVQAMSDPAPSSRLRPYQGVAASQAASPQIRNGGANPPKSPPSLEAYENPQGTPEAATPMPWPSPASQQQFSAAVPQPGPTGPLPPKPQPYSSSIGADPLKSPNQPVSTSQMPAASVPLSSAAPPPSQSGPATASSVPTPVPYDPNAPKSGLQRAMDAFRSTIPLVQKLLPLIDGNIATAVGALMTQHTHPAPPPPPPQVRIDLEPVERGLAEIRSSNRELRNQIAEQATQFKRVEDQLDRVREATDRNTLEQQELVEDLRAVGNRISSFAIIGVLVLLISLGLNIYLLLQLQHILR